ncbi:MAG: hypothetical protein ABJD07_15925, partial [Gemmatimonadaceae bacterium]
SVVSDGDTRLGIITEHNGAPMRWRLITAAAFMLTGDTRPAAVARSVAPATRAVPILRVIGTDYAFQLPAVVHSGRTTIVLENQGRVAHEMLLAPLRDGVTGNDLAKAAQEGVLVQPFIERFVDGAPAGVLFALPATTSPGRLATMLVSGRSYAVVCNFRDSPTAARHMALGMFKTFRVE